MSDNFLKIKNGIGLKPKNLATIVNPVAGDVACDESDNKIKFYDVSTSTWKEMGSSSGGGAVDSVNGQTGTVVLTKSDVGLSNVDNTSDANKPISTATQAALDNIKQKLDTVFQLTAKESLATWTTTLSGGSVFSKETTTPINGTESYKLTLGTDLGQQLKSPSQYVPPKFRGKTNSFSFSYSYDGGNADITASLVDANTNTTITEFNLAIPGTNGSIQKLYSVADIPLTTTDVRVDFVSIVANNGKVLNFGDIQLGVNSEELLTNISNITEWSSSEPITFGGATPPTKGTTRQADSISWRQVAENYEVVVRYAQSSAGTQGTGDYIINLPTGVEIDQSVLGIGTTTTSAIGKGSMAYTDGSTKFSTDAFAYSYSGSTNSFKVRFVINNTTVATWGQGTPAGALSGTTVGVTLFLSFKGKGLSASNPNIVTQVQTFSSDRAAFTYAPSSTYTLSTLPNAPIGTYITFTYAANSNTRTQTTTRPTQTDADMNVNGMQIFTRAYNAASTAASPAVFAIQIGKGMKGTSLNLYKSVGRSISGEIDYCQTSNTSSIGLTVKSYNESTGILIIDAGNQQPTTTNSNIRFSDTTEQTNGYITINASKSPALVGINAPKRYIVSTYSNGTDWYEIYSDGWIRQGKYINTGSAPQTVTYLVAMKDTNYSIYGSIRRSDTTAQTAFYQSSTANNISILGSTTQNANLVVEGYASAAALAALGIIVNY